MTGAHKIVFIQLILLVCSIAACLKLSAQSEDAGNGINEQSPSRSQYFSWINHTNEGPDEAQTMANLAFFKWLSEAYGMSLDIYAFDAGTIDGRHFYGSMDSDRFRNQFPNGFSPLQSLAQSFDVRLGLWGGPDGFGDTPQEQKNRKNLLVSLVRDYGFELFKFDAVCSHLRPEKQEAFAETIRACRQYAPDLIVLNHRLDLGPEGNELATTKLLGGKETYIDVHTLNESTGTHHRVGALDRDPTPDLIRLAEDHGVCLSSCLDYWEDDLVLQAFNRNLILAPQIYGNPWLLSDDEFPKLARLFNLHEQYNDKLVNGLLLDESKYGKGAVSRGDEHTRLITLKNLSWDSLEIDVVLNAQIGLVDNGERVVVHQYHPTERMLGVSEYGSSFQITVPSFRSVLLKVSNTTSGNDIVIQGTDYEIIKTNDTGMELDLLGFPAQTKKVRLIADSNNFSSATIEGEDASVLLTGDELEVNFPGAKLQNSVHRKLVDLKEVPVPEDVFSLFEATQFAADNNSLEARSLARSGATQIPQVQAARDAFFNQETFVTRDTWDQYLFDDDLSTQYSIALRYESFNPKAAAFRINFGEKIILDSLQVHFSDLYGMQPMNKEEGEYIQVTADLVEWEPVKFISDSVITVRFPRDKVAQYLSFPVSFLRVCEVVGFRNGQEVDRSKWSASNLQRPYVFDWHVFDWHWDKERHYYARGAWSASFVLEEVPKNSYLCVAINGKHGVEGAIAALKIDGQYIGSPDRSPSYRSNTWEYRVAQTDKNYTYYFPLSDEFLDKEIKAYVLGFFEEHLDLKPEVWITSYPHSFEKKRLILKENQK